MFRSIRARIIAATAGCLVVALLLNTVINFQVTRQDNQQSQRDILTSTSASHNMAIADWVKSKMTVIASAQTVALSDDPVPVFKQLAQAGGFTNVYVGYASKTAKFSEPAGVPADYDPTIRPWYQQVVSTDGPVVTAPYVDAGTGKLVVTFAVPVKENGALKAVVAGDVAMDSVVANVRGIHPTPSSSGLLLNSDGSVIAANDPALTLKPFAETIKGIDFAALKSGNLVDGTLNDVEKTFVATAVPGTNWLLVVALDNGDATSGMRSLLKASAISLVILALLILAPLLSWLPLSAMAALLLMVAWNMSEAHKVINLLRHAPKDDIVVMLMCMSLTVLFDMVIAISVGIVLASLLFMRRIARMTHLAPVNVEVPDDVLVLRVIGPLFFAAAEGLFNDLETRIAGKRIVVLKWDAVPVLDAGGLDAFQRFVNKLPEGCELRVSNLEFQPLRTLARAGVKPLPGRLSFYPDRQAALADL